MTAVAGFFLSVPVYGQNDPIISRLNAATIDEAHEAADEMGRIAFAVAGYETMDTVYATLYQIGPKGGLIHSECFTIDGPDAQ